jgi:non-heme chloroperoxidase
VPIADSALLSAKIVKRATLKVYQGAPHGMCTTLKDRVNADLLSFIET